MRGEIRMGRVSSTDAKAHTAKVTISDGPGGVDWVTGDLQVLITRPGDYALPANDAPVLCLLLDGVEGVGFVLGSLYTESDAPPLSDAGQRSIASDDLRLGDPAADQYVALADKVKSELDAIKGVLNNHTHLAGTLVAPPGGGAVTGATAALVGSYNPNAVAAAKVKAK